MTDKNVWTHTAFTKRRIGKTHFVWLEIGRGRTDVDGTFHADLDRLPIGGFTGYVYFAPPGTKPPEAEPRRPDQVEDDNA